MGLKGSKIFRATVVDDRPRMRNINVGLSREVAREGNVLGGIFYSGLGYQIAEFRVVSFAL
jgi:hypothetical protein